MPAKIALISDIHYALEDPGADGAKRRCAIADILFRRTIQRVNRLVRPDITLILGDLVDDGEAPGAREGLESIHHLTTLIDGPCLVLPGNHDGDVDRFFDIFPAPPEFLDVGGVRLVPFVDPEEPGYNARREPRALERLAAARRGFSGPIISVQHVPLFPPGLSECPYNYTNAPEIIEAMREHGVGLSLSAHYHKGMDIVRAEGVSFLAAPALCESPFRFLEVTLDRGEVSVVTHSLRMPDELGLVDTHVHTHFAYCNENMNIPTAMALAEDFGLAGMGFSEHSDHLYFNKKTVHALAHIEQGIQCQQGRERRMEDYLKALGEAGCPPRSVGLEVDSDYHGRPILDPADREDFSYLIGAIHQIRELRRPEKNVEAAADEFLYLLERFLPCGIRVLAHPFRIFPRRGVELPERLFEPTVRLLREHGVAAEINFHTNEPRPEFIRLCIESGVKLTFGSDAHNLYEVGDFALHLNLLKTCGYDGPLEDILIDPRG